MQATKSLQSHSRLVQQVSKGLKKSGIEFKQCTEGLRGIFVVEIMYRKRYRYYTHNYDTIAIFYPVSVDVIFLECFDPE